MSAIRFVDTTIRDGQSSLWASSMRTRHMLPAMPYLDAAGFDSMEFIATGSKLKKFVRDLKENPWDWIKQGAAAAKLTPLRWHGGQISGSTLSGYVPREVGELLIKKAVDLGIRLTRTGSNWNDYRSLAGEVERLKELGMTSVVNVMYSVSPRHTDEYFVQKAREAASVATYRLCLKDVGGILTPDRIRSLLPKMLAVTGDIPWEFHGHCNNGFGPINAIECAKAGIEYIHTAVPPLANANSQPSIFNVARNLLELGFDVDINEEVLAGAQKHFEYVAKLEKFQTGRPYEYDEHIYRHQIPGGMMSNLRHQLEVVGIADRFEELLDEVPRVRADFGYPIMVTPLSQIVGVQSAVNVIVGERYRQVTDETIEYALGRHGGSEAVDGMDADVRDKILSRPRAEEIAALTPWEPTLAELHQRYGRDIDDEDLILRAIVGDDAVELVGRASSPRPASQSSLPLKDLIRELSERKTQRYIAVQAPGFSLKMWKSQE